MRGLAAALPEAFVDVHLAESYDFGEELTLADRSRDPTDDGWATTIPLADAMRWIETEALVVDRPNESTTVRADRLEALRRFFGYIEREIVARAEDDRGWLMVELFEHVQWTEDVIEHLGPQTVALLRVAQVSLADFSSQVGRWHES